MKIVLDGGPTWKAFGLGVLWTRRNGPLEILFLLPFLAFRLRVT